MKSFSIISAAAALVAFLAVVPHAQAQPVCAPSTASVSGWDCGATYNPYPTSGEPPVCVANVYCKNGRTGEVRHKEGSSNFIAQISADNSTGRTFDPNCGRAVDAYCY